MNHEPKKECFKTSVGGQALMEGIMMRGPEHICCAVRKPDGTIETKIDDTPKHGIWAKIPLVRGAISMIESLITGYHYMMYSAQVSMGDEYDAEEEESAFEKWVGDHLGKKAEDILMAGAALVGGLFAILLFTVLPTVLVGGLGKVVTLTRWPRVILEAVLKVAIFLSYMVAISKMKEIHRVFEYHGAEHKTIACYEAGDELTVENVRKYTRFHPRCGTSFLILVVIVSVFLYSVLPWSSTSPAPCCGSTRRTPNISTGSTSTRCSTASSAISGCAESGTNACGTLRVTLRWRTSSTVLAARASSAP